MTDALCFHLTARGRGAVVGLALEVGPNSTRHTWPHKEKGVHIIEMCLPLFTHFQEKRRKLRVG